MNRSSLWGRNEYKNTNETANKTSFLTLGSKAQPTGTKNVEAANPRGKAE